VPRPALKGGDEPALRDARFTALAIARRADEPLDARRAREHVEDT
jgi:hypothetical protein